jgi:cytochrome P450
MNLLDAPEFGEKFFAMMQASAPSYNNFVQFPIMVYIIRNGPVWASRLLGEHAYEFKKVLSGARKQVVQVKAAFEASGRKKPARPTIFHHLLDPEVASEHGVPSDDLLADEAQTLLAAASETTGNAMSMTTYYVLSDEKVYRRLVAELKEAFPDANKPLEYLKLEKLTYLTAVIKEGLRLSFGVLHRLPRVVPEPGATFNGYEIPAGAVVGMSTWLMHQDENTFPDPKKYDPERWLNPEAVKQLEKYVVPFSRGSRSCLGMNLAYEELYVTLGTFFRRFDNLVVDGTGPEDLVYEDYFNMYHPIGARKLHVKQKE